jgi:signal transduction histidine kinase
VEDSANSTDRTRHRLEDAVDLVDRCTAEIRTLSYLLHPPLLDEVGLASAISWYVEGFSERSGITVDLNVPQDLPRFPSEMDTALFRIVQQSLANVHKHSGGKRASIRVGIAGSNLVVEVSDEGRGMSPEVLAKFRAGGQSPGVGISGMRERVLGLRGSFEIKSERSGTTIVASVPIPGQG